MAGFLWRRFKRIYPPLIWALLLTYALDNSALLITPAQYHIADVNTVTSYAPLIPRLMTTLLLIPNPVPEWGSNLALWSLRLEWWFYLLYPLLWMLSKRSLLFATGVLFALFTWSLYPVAPVTNSFFVSWILQVARTIFAYSLVWWLGALLAEMYVGRLRLKFVWLTPLMVIALPLFISMRTLHRPLSHSRQWFHGVWR